MSTYDLIVIGGGSGGIACGRRAAQYGARVLLFEDARLGGTCVNVGCVPKKVMWNASHVKECIDKAPDYGFEIGSKPFDFQSLKQSRDSYVKRLNGIYDSMLGKAQVETIRERAKLIGPGKVEALGKVYEARHIVIATGGYPTRPPVPGSDLGIDSDGFFDLDKLPEKIAIVGAGYIAVEIACVFASLGSEVHLVVRSKLLRTFDQEISRELEEHMKYQGVHVHMQCSPTEVNRASDQSYVMNLSTGNSLKDLTEVLWATGRAPNTKSLGLESCTIEVDGAGAIKTDDFENTSCAGIYAIGDVNGKIALTPVAIAAGRRLAARLFLNQTDAKLNYDLVPTVVFSHPPIGTVGLSQEQANEKFGAENVEIKTSKFTNMWHSLSKDKPKTLMKLVIHKPDQKVIGLHGIGEGMDEMLQGFAVALKCGATFKEFEETVAIHPTASEEFVTMI